MDEVRVSTNKRTDLDHGFCPLCEDTNDNGGLPVRRERPLGPHATAAWYCPNCDTIIYIRAEAA